MSTTTKRQLPPDPRTVAEMIPVRLAEITSRTAPTCGKPYHGVAVARPHERQTYEQMWCGVWYDCQSHGCGTSWCWASRELAAFHGEPYEAADGQYETWTGAAWQRITQADRDAYWAQREAESKRREAAQVAAARKTRRRRTA